MAFPKLSARAIRRLMQTTAVWLVVGFGLVAIATFLHACANGGAVTVTITRFGEGTLEWYLTAGVMGYVFTGLGLAFEDLYDDTQ